MIEAKLTAALARLFEQNLALQDTGCEMHAVRRTVDWRAKLFEKFGHWLCDVLHWCTLESDQLFPAIRAFRNTFLVKDKEKIGWFWYYLIGGSASEPLHEDETVTHSEFDHFEPWGEYMDVEKGVMAKAVRVPRAVERAKAMLPQRAAVRNGRVATAHARVAPRRQRRPRRQRVTRRRREERGRERGRVPEVGRTADHVSPGKIAP